MERTMVILHTILKYEERRTEDGAKNKSSGLLCGHRGEHCCLTLDELSANLNSSFPVCKTEIIPGATTMENIHLKYSVVDWFRVNKCSPVEMFIGVGGSGKELTCQCRRCKRYECDPWVRKIPWRREWQPTPVFLPGC